MKKFSFLLLVLFFCISLFAQEEYMQKNKNYSSARIRQKNNKILKVRNLKLINDTIISYKVSGSPLTLQLPVDEINYVTVKKGSKALSYGLWGAGIGLFSVGITHLIYSSDPLYDGFNWAPMYIGFTVGCGAIGAVIGAFSYKWKRLYFHDKSTASLMIYPNIQPNSYRIGIVLTF